MRDPRALQFDAEGLAARAPALLAQAQDLAQSVIIGSHGRRRPGAGEDFWQYRQAQSGDPARLIDWRRSARSDTSFVQDKEWQIAQTMHLWVDPAASMHFASAGMPTKAQRARVLGLALMIGLARGGERTGLTGPALPPRRGMGHLSAMAEMLAHAPETGDFGTPDLTGIAPRAGAVFISDFLGDLDATEAALSTAVARGVKGALLQVLDPSEEAFPYAGRTIFESMQGALRHETLDAGGLRGAYLARLAERKARLSELALKAGWQFSTHVTERPAAPALLWLHGALGRG